MISYSDPPFGDLTDQRTWLLIRLLNRNLSGDQTRRSVEAAGLDPDGYHFDFDISTVVAWMAVVPDAAKRGTLRDLVDAASRVSPAFSRQVEHHRSQLSPPVAPRRGWYWHHDPYKWTFVGLPSIGIRPFIDRVELRARLRALAEHPYGVLVVYGKPRSGKSYTWRLVEHLRNVGLANEPALVQTDDRTEVTGGLLAQRLVDKLHLPIELAAGGDLENTRIGRFLDRLVGEYSQGDSGNRWIVLDGLDRPGVQEGARDLARRLIQLVERGELPRTRLIVTGLDPLELGLENDVPTEVIPTIDRPLVRAFLTDVAQHLGRATTDEELDKWVTEIFGPDSTPRDLSEVEATVRRLVTTHWVPEGQGG